MNKYLVSMKKKVPSLKRRLLGMKLSDGILYKLGIYFLLITIGFVFLYPILYMLSVSFMSNIDLADNTIKWIPSVVNFENYKMTSRALQLPTSLLTSFLIAGIPTICVAFASSLIGYGLARYHFFGKKIIILLIILTFILPKTLFFIPTYEIYTSLRINGSLATIILPALTGQGLQAAFFILIFYQFFTMIPKALEEAAVIDGARSFKIFSKIALPTAGPAFIITFVYSFALYWNEQFYLTVYLNGRYKTIPMLLSGLQDSYEKLTERLDASKLVNVGFTESKLFAGTILSIIPLIIIYAIVQKWFVESIDKSGITGE